MTQKKLLRVITAILQYGAEGLHTQKEIFAFIKECEYDPNLVHLRGDKGLFEPVDNKEKEKPESEQRLRLNATGVAILMSHLSMRQAKRQAIIASVLSIIALFFAVASRIPFLDMVSGLMRVMLSEVYSFISLL